MEDRAEGFEAFVAARSTALLRTAHLLTGDLGHAEDLLQTALERTYRHWRRVDEPEAYARAALASLATDRWRQRARRVREVGGWLPERPGADDHRGVEQRHDLVAALAALTPRQRAVLVLRFFDDLSEPQTAHALGISVGTVKSTASRALAALRERHPDLVRSTP